MGGSGSNEDETGSFWVCDDLRWKAEGSCEDEAPTWRSFGIDAGLMIGNTAIGKLMELLLISPTGRDNGGGFGGCRVTVDGARVTSLWRGVELGAVIGALVEEEADEFEKDVESSKSGAGFVAVVGCSFWVETGRRFDVADDETGRGIRIEAVGGVDVGAAIAGVGKAVEC